MPSDCRPVWSALYTGTGDVIVRRVRGTAPQPIYGQNRSLVVSSSLFVSTSLTGAVAGLTPPPVENSHATVVLSNVTLNEQEHERQGSTDHDATPGAPSRAPDRQRVGDEESAEAFWMLRGLERMS
jgi:hypothetical protein